MGILVLAACLVLALSKAEGTDDSYQCHELHEYDASVKGEVTSPFYNERERYHDGLWCEYRIRSPEGTGIKITFLEIDITCPQDILVIYSEDRQKVLARICGSEPPYPLVSLPGENEIRLLFYTIDSVAPGKGFRLQYESAPNMTLCPDGLNECKNRNCYDPKKRCDGVDDCGDDTDEEGCDNRDYSYQCRKLYEYDASVKGEVTSPFYNERERYHDRLWCEYRIRSPEGTRIKVTFSDLDIACPQDYLVVYSKDKKDLLGMFCGSVLPYPVVSLPGENEIRLLFRTDFMVSGKGFRLQYESAPNMELCQNGLSECKNRNCYDPKKKCDGVDDCNDGTDEEDCGFPLVVEPKECGKPRITPNTIFGGSDRMVGGETVIPNSWPWQVSLQTMNSEPNGHFCGGTLLNAQWVLTATHCVARSPYPETLKIVIGSHYKFKKTPYEQTRRAVKIIAYPDLEKEAIRTYPWNHDITLVKLNAPVQFNDGVQPACLPNLGWQLKPGWTCYATGWGETRGSGGSDQLKQMEQVIQTYEQCSYDNKTMICVGKPYNSPCHGDSGGPLQCRIEDTWYVFGAASFVTTTNMMSGLCVGPGAKTVYANVIDKVDWIKTVINKYS